MKSPVRSSHGFKYMFEFPRNFRIYTDDQGLLSTIMAQCNMSEVSTSQEEKRSLVGRLHTRYQKAEIVYDIFDEGKCYKIVSSRSADKTRGASISKSIVERVYAYLARSHRKRSGYNIESVLGISSATVLNALRVLRTQKRAKFESYGKHGRQQFKAV